MLALPAQKCHSTWESHDLYCVPVGNVPLWGRLHWDAGKASHVLVISYLTFQQEGR